MPNELIIDNRILGWINPELVEKYQFEASAAEAWEKNGGGKFSYKDPLGTGKKRSGSGRLNAKVIHCLDTMPIHLTISCFSMQRLLHR